MQTEEFVNEVARAANLSDHEVAAAVSRATVETICAHLPAEQVRELSSQLPQDLTRAAEAGRTQTTETPAEISQDEFFKQVAIRAEQDRAEIEPAVRAAITVFKCALSRGETTDIVFDAPRELDALLTG
ncbi:MAG: DUF2267 domain-containing protein [Salinisphaera sp.]|uniref:DUF2267 domain-containing protein n=1 Tax=Salinisphaera sp. TaxID=1914330 RepID=UPI003C7DB23D